MEIIIPIPASLKSGHGNNPFSPTTDHIFEGGSLLQLGVSFSWMSNTQRGCIFVENS